MGEGENSTNSILEDILRNQLGPKPALTFDDISLIPVHADFIPYETDVSTRLTRNIRINIPLVSAAMDTVTRHKMAIAIAQMGGCGIIDRNATVREQVWEMKRVQYAWNMVLDKPITLAPETTVRKALERINRYGFKDFPVMHDNNLEGIFYWDHIKHMLLDEGTYGMPVSSLMTPVDSILTIQFNQRYSNKDYFEQARKIFAEFANRHQDKIAVVASKNGKIELKGLISFKDLKKRNDFRHVALHKDALLYGIAVGGYSKKEAQRVHRLVNEGAYLLCVDSSHGDCRGVERMVEHIKTNYNHVEVIAGNVCTEEGARHLIDSGADAVKVGVGPGSICTTRIVTGGGIPQLTAINECALYAKKHRVPIIADGGIRNPGDITKAIAAGAESVMIGSGFAGTDEAPGEEVIIEGVRYRAYDGMGSTRAMNRRGQGFRYHETRLIQNMDIATDAMQKPVAQGVATRIKAKGPVLDVLHYYVGGLRHGMGLTGCRTLADLCKPELLYQRCRLVTNAGNAESHPRYQNIE